jgi:uncharacterized membrane protein YbaN (DUF454 family)
MTAPDGRSELGSGGATRRWIWFAVGWGFTALGLVGVAVPLLPTTPFLILALWAFSRSSRRFHDWIVEHPVLGPPVRRWREERVIPLRVKLLALGSMLASLGYVAFSVRPPWYALAAMGVVVAAAVAFLASVPSRPAAGSGKDAPSGP